MVFSFINPSRSYDAANRHVRFVGYDGMKSVRFAVELGALSKAGFGAVEGEVQSLAAFDAVRASVHDVARTASARASQPTCYLKAADFRWR